MQFDACPYVRWLGIAQNLKFYRISLLRIIGQWITDRGGEQWKREREEEEKDADIAAILRPATQFKYHAPRIDGNKFEEEG